MTHDTKNPQRQPGATQGNNYALRHGLFAKEDVLEGEDHSEYVQLTARVMNEEGVVGAVEGQLASRMASLLWRLGRIARLEARVWEESPNAAEMLNCLQRLSFYEGRLGRELERVRKELKAIQADRTYRNVSEVQYGPPREREKPRHAEPAPALARQPEKTISPRPSSEIWSPPLGDPFTGSTVGVPIECQGV